MMSEKAQKHFERYVHNLALAAEIESLLPRAADWVCVLRFYAALHLTNAYLIDKGNIRFDPDSTEHKERKQSRPMPGIARRAGEISAAERPQ